MYTLYNIYKVADTGRNPREEKFILAWVALICSKMLQACFKHESFSNFTCSGMGKARVRGEVARGSLQSPSGNLHF